MPIILPYMVRSGEQQHITESYVSVPPALVITDETGAIWTLGFRSGEAPSGEFAFNVLRNGRETGEVASRIERLNNRIRVFTRQGWKWMNSRASDSTMSVFGIGARIKSDSMPDSEMPLETPLPIEVSVWRDQPSSRPFVTFMFNPLAGGVKVVSPPLRCAPGQWLSARTRPVAARIEVMAYLGQKTMRAIPTVNLDIVEG